MIKKVFLDSDVILDVATGREPFFESSVRTLSIIENDLAIGVISSNSATHIFYVLRKISGKKKSLSFLCTLLDYVSVIPVNHENVVNALSSGFGDFKDAVQYYCALDNRCGCIITRNVEDYAQAKIPILLPGEFAALYA